MKNFEAVNFSRCSFVNFILVAMLGALLRYMICFPSGSLNYLNILHAHSHFAFAGWIFMALVILILKQVSEKVSTEYRWILLLTQICSFGMLISFSLQGYKAVSIIFSTVFLLIGYCFAYTIFRQWKSKGGKTLSEKLIKAGLGSMLLSSLGPFALGAFKASGITGPVYNNAIYFYLHFQMNGWMLFAALGLILGSVSTLQNKDLQRVAPAFNIFILSTIPLFLIFMLWANPPQWVYFSAFAAALLNAASWFILAGKLKNVLYKSSLLVKVALISISLKVILQLVICIPSLGEWTFINRNLIIGYVHLLTLGCVTPVIINRFSALFGVESKLLDVSYVILTGFYLSMLIGEPVLRFFSLGIPNYQYLLLVLSILFCLSGLAYFMGFFINKNFFNKTHKYLNPFCYESNH